MADDQQPFETTLFPVTDEGENDEGPPPPPAQRAPPSETGGRAARETPPGAGNGGGRAMVTVEDVVRMLDEIKQAQGPVLSSAEATQTLVQEQWR